MRRATGLAAEQVRRLRTQHGWSARQLAEECARAGLHTLTRSTIAKIESGVRKSITAEEVEVLARVLGTTPTDLLSPSPENRRGASLTVLHLSDIQFGRDYLFGGHGRVSADHDRDVLFSWLQGDLEQLADDPGLWPDLLVVTGGLTASGGVSEFGQAKEFLTGLAEKLGLERRQIVVVPGNHDVSRSACRAYFLRCEADEVDPQPPYRQKWDHFIRLLQDLHGADGEIVTFDAERQWTLFEVPDLRVVVAGLNSTIADSHRDEDHYGLVGEEQALWFADRLAQYQDKGWLRIGAVHHNPIRAAMLDDQERLRDVDTVDRLLGSRLNLLLHGHGAGVHYLGSGLAALGTGTAAAAHPRSTAVPNRYQLLRITGDGLTRWARSYDQASQRWIADTGTTPDGGWPERISRPWRAVGATFPAPTRPEPAPATEPTSRDTASQVGSAPVEPDLNDPGSVLLHRIAAICEARHQGATIHRFAGNPPYLLITFVDDGFTPQLRLGACLGDPTREDVDAFLTGAYAADPGITSELVYQGRRASSDLENYARGRGVRLRSLLEFQGLLDLRGYVAWQTAWLATPPNYSSERYVPQRFRMIEDDTEEVHQDLPGTVLRWLRSDDMQFVMLLSEVAEDKTFLLHELARRLPKEIPDLLPVLIDLPAQDKTSPVDELVRRHLLAHGQSEGFTTQKFHYLLTTGRVVLLLDGSNELVQPVKGQGGARTHGAPTQYRVSDDLTTLMGAAVGKAKIVVTGSAPSNSTTQIRELVGPLSGYRLVQIEHQQSRRPDNRLAGTWFARPRKEGG